LASRSPKSQGLRRRSCGG